MDGQTYLITGGDGFIGSNFIWFLLSQKEKSRVINLDKFTYAGNLENLREWIFVKDVCSALLAVLDNRNTGEVYNIDSGIEPKNIDV